MAAHEDGIARSGARPEPADGTITLAATSSGARGFPGTSRFTTSSPELGVIDVFSQHAIESQHQFARHGGDGHGAVFFLFHEAVVEAAQVTVGFAVHDAVRGLDQQVPEQPDALLGDVAHANDVAAGRLARVEAAIGGHAPRAIESCDRLERVDHRQRGEQTDAGMGSQQPGARILFRS